MDGGQTFNIYTSNSRRHPGHAQATGINEADKVYNIYDLEGNYPEGVAGLNTYMAGVNCQYMSRGSAYAHDGYGASLRSGMAANPGVTVTFRFVLYIIK